MRRLANYSFEAEDEAAEKKTKKANKKMKVEEIVKSAQGENN